MDEAPTHPYDDLRIAAYLRRRGVIDIRKRRAQQAANNEYVDQLSDLFMRS